MTMIRSNSEGVWCRAQRPLGILDENGERWVRIALPLPDDDEGSKVHTCTKCGWEAPPSNTCCGACGGDITETDEGET